MHLLHRPAGGDAALTLRPLDVSVTAGAEINDEENTSWQQQTNSWNEKEGSADSSRLMTSTVQQHDSPFMHNTIYNHHTIMTTPTFCYGVPQGSWNQPFTPYVLPSPPGWWDRSLGRRVLGLCSPTTWTWSLYDPSQVIQWIHTHVYMLPTVVSFHFYRECFGPSWWIIRRSWVPEVPHDFPHPYIKIFTIIDCFSKAVCCVSPSVIMMTSRCINSKQRAHNRT